MIIGAIDIGTNSTRYLIVEGNHRGIQCILKRGGKITRLGKGIGTRQSPIESPMENTYKYLTEIKTIIDQYKPEHIQIVSTSIAREGLHHHTFFKQIEQLFGSPLQIISGEEEARLAFLGAKDCIQQNKANLVIDIGGGSTEFIFSHADTLKQCYSLPIGCVRCTEQYLPSDPPTNEEQSKLLDIVEEIIRSVIIPLPKVEHLIGTAGTITTLGAIHLALETYQPDLIHKSEIQYTDVVRIHELLSECSLNERKSIKGLEAQRADIINAGVLILLSIMKIFSCHGLTISDHGLLFGLAERTLL
ncbi:MAG: Ppx/GppA family phosphatase [Chlamydiota bacterium]|nr:Ppx/GppA family phosphatase [Chlamydiota bacterium]